MAAPTLYYHASEAVKRELLPGLLSGETIWCQGFSEPGAGSDLAGVQTFAEKKGDKWIINGHKVWTSLAHFAEWMIILLRTDKSHKYEGLSYFVVPIRSALGNGVTVRPLIKITGETGFNEVLFEDVRVPVSHLLATEGDGFLIADLAHKRGIAVTVWQLGDPDKIIGALRLKDLHALKVIARVFVSRFGQLGQGKNHRFLQADLAVAGIDQAGDRFLVEITVDQLERQVFLEAVHRDAGTAVAGSGR